MHTDADRATPILVTLQFTDADAGMVLLALYAAAGISPASTRGLYHRLAEDVERARVDAAVFEEARADAARIRARD